MSSGRIRTFVAIEMPEDLKDELVRLQGTVDCGGADVRWSSPETMHLTLAFLGDIELASVNSVVDACREAAASAAGARPEVVIEAMELFPSPRRPRVVAAQVHEEEKLLRLQAAVEGKLAAAGFATERRAYRPHITVGRIRGRSGIGGLGRSLRELSDDGSLGRFEADEIVVFQSELASRGAVHTPLARVELAGREEANDG